MGNSVKKWGLVVESMLMGDYRHSLDSKNRIIIPSRFREELGDTFVVSVGLDGCLSIYTVEQWEKLLSNVISMPFTKTDVRLLTRHMTSNAITCEVDAQGRIQLPSKLVMAANLLKKCAIIGAADHVEIWSEERWDAYDLQASESFESIAESLTEFLK